MPTDAKQNMINNVADPAASQLANSPVAPAVNPSPMSNAADPLAAFKDIQMPDPVSWWPLAWGWWLLIALAILLVTGLIFGFIRYQKKQRAKKQAIRLINQLDDNASINALNTLLKQAMLSYFPREQVASLSGRAWYEFLIAQLKPNDQAEFTDLKAFCDHQYQPNKQLSAQDKTLIIHYLKKALPAKSTKAPIQPAIHTKEASNV
ncbi:DUF4381 domain-containing protein [Catenovulum sp. 2E275]|uniref:DUF4381 domain-containing protein n=1 Tax=Catenovulum sp. 2E275 TaxID=2980497 RepID=UPI0021D12179|nr:DUF4381 domain-containing protein [Catenovulum sp. 2E275]MCU4676879.1 DUF4381 domain-containing protein [Catenovulum sp. 2E275]